MASKHKNQILHARRRAKERAGIDLTPDLRRQLINDIQKGRAKFMWSQSNRVSVWRVFLAGKKFLAIYDKDRHSIVTFLYTRRPGEQDFHYVVFDK
jgi:hypothetical protein